VEFKNVSFTYSTGEEVLNGINISAEPGRVVAVVGPSGAGKSTIAKLIPRFYDVTVGRVLVDGHDVRDLTLDSLRKHMGIVPQETMLFHGSVRENIAYGKLNASLAEIQQAARDANAHDFILRLENGYDTVVGERGVKLSGGQRQRISIARALLKDPRILILDEATSNLDTESEKLVQAALDRLMQGRTTFIIAHRLSTIRNADEIIVIHGGKIVDRGTHDELFTRPGVYRELYEIEGKITA
jgi:subfamily B ATP-binding cassette protein MsbA